MLNATHPLVGLSEPSVSLDVNALSEPSVSVVDALESTVETTSHTTD